MRYYDALYNVEWELPKIVEKIIHTKEMARLRNITQGIMPNNLNVRGPLPSRFQHSMGVCILAKEVLNQNPKLFENGSSNLLTVSALLHDAGNPPFSHLSEPFLKEVTGHDGESFLIEILDGSETEKVLKEYGIHFETVVKIVTGNWKPFSDVLNGSMDLDNLDNIARHARAANLPIHFDPLKIAHAFHFEDEWLLNASLLPENPFLGNTFLQVKAWKEARALVYGGIYSAPHLIMAMMLQRAVELAHSNRELSRDFFTLDDYAATLILQICNSGTRKLINRLLRWQVYDEIVSLDYQNPSEKIKSLAKGYKGRKAVADVLSKKLNISQEDVCVLILKGKDFRRVTLPFVANGRMSFLDEKPDHPLYRIRVYTNSELNLSKDLVYDLTMQEIS